MKEIYAYVIDMEEEHIFALCFTQQKGMKVPMIYPNKEEALSHKKEAAKISDACCYDTKLIKFTATEELFHHAYNKEGPLVEPNRALVLGNLHPEE